MAFNLGSLAPLAGLMQSDQLMQRRQYNEVLKQIAQQQLLESRQQQQALPGLYRALSQMGQAPMPDQGGVGGFLQPPTQLPQQLPMPGGSQPGQATGATPNLAGSSVNWQGEDPEFQRRVSAMLGAAPADVRQASVVDSGRRTTEQQAEIYERSGHGTKFMAAPPSKSLHETGQAADWTFKTPQADQWLHQNARRFGLDFPLGPRDPNHMQLAKLDTELDQQGLKLIQNGVPGPEVQDTTKLGMMAGRQIDPTQWGRATRKQIIDAIEKTSSGESDTVKALTFLQLNKLMAPEEKMQAQMWARENQQNIQLAIANLRATTAERGQDMANQRAMFSAGAASQRQERGIEARRPPGAVLPDDVAEMLAEQALAGDQSWKTNLGRGIQGAENIVKVQTIIDQKRREQGLTGADLATKGAEFQGLKAGERTLSTRTANIGMRINEAQRFAPIALAASEMVDRTEFPTFNRLYEAGLTGTGDENIVRLSVATQSLLNAYAAAVTPTGTPTEGSQNRARALLDQAWSKGQFRTAINQLLVEMDAASKSPGTVREEFRRGASAPTSGGQPVTGPTSGGLGAPQGIIERGGKRWRIIGGDPNDPDVEEVK